MFTIISAFTISWSLRWKWFLIKFFKSFREKEGIDEELGEA